MTPDEQNEAERLYRIRQAVKMMENTDRRQREEHEARVAGAELVMYAALGVGIVTIIVFGMTGGLLLVLAIGLVLALGLLALGIYLRIQAES